MNQIKKLVIGAFIFSITIAKAQLSGTLTVPGTYTSIAAAVNALNTLGVSGPVTFNIAAGYTETAPVGGYALTATGTAVNTITFRKNGVGANPLITAYAGGTGTPGSAAQDGIFSLIGSDYITIDGINLIDPNITNPETMEYGYGLFKSSATNGCQNNTIKNCIITLNRENNAAGIAPSVDGSRGINVVNSLISSQTTVLTVASASGSNSNNNFFSNTIDNCNIGIALIGFADVTPFTFADFGNNVGGSSITTGNIIRNFGGANFAANPSAAVRTLAQYDVNVSFNTINNNTGTGVNHPTTLRGIYLNTAVSANASVNNNTLTLQFGGTTSPVSVIENVSGATAASNTISISNNLITNCTNSLTTTGQFYGIWNNLASAANLNITNNTFTNNTSNATFGATYLIYNSGSVTTNINISNNTLGFSYTGSAAYTGLMYNIYNTTGSIFTSTTINNNIFSSFNHVNVTGTGSIYFIFVAGGGSNLSINSNLFNGLTFNHSGSQFYIYSSSSIQNSLSISSNTITNITRTAAAGNMYCYYVSGASLPVSSQVISNNLISNITATVSGTGSFISFYSFDGATSPYPKKRINNNNIVNINYNASGFFYGIYANYLGQGSTTSGSEIFNNKIENITTNNNSMSVLYSGNLSSPNYPVSVYQNTITNVTSNAATSLVYGAYVMSGLGGINFLKNKIYDITSNGANGTVHGIFAATTSTTTMYNNLIGNLYAPNTTGDNRVNGINIAAGTNINAYYNTVYIPVSTSTSTLFGSNALYASTTPNVTLRNNIFVNLSTPVGAAYAVAYRRSSLILTSYALSSNNNLFYAGIPSPNNLIYFDGTTGQSLMSVYKGIVFPNDASSVTENPPFISTVGSATNFLNLNTSIATQIQAGAQPIAGITADYIGTVRNVSTPDIGAWEGNFTPYVACSGSPVAGSITGASAICIGKTTNLVLTGATVGFGINYQWASSTTPGGPYTTLLGTAPSQTVAPSVSPTYYVVSVVCAASSLTATTAQFSVLINPLPVIVTTPTLSTFCYPGGTPVILSASGASTYTWSPTIGLSSSTGSAVAASPAGARIYTVTATNVNGCVNTQTASVNVSTAVRLDSISASPNNICSGGNSILTAFSSIPTFTYCQATYASGTLGGDYLSYVSVNTLTNTTGGSPAPYYTLYPQTGATTTTLVAGNTYTLKLIAGTFGNNDLAAFIDYGQNGILDDVGEKLGEVDNLLANPNVANIVFTVPLSAMNGITRLRVREMDHPTFNDITPCLVQSAFGETEDYSITITGGVNNAVTYAWSPSTYLSSTAGSSVSASNVSLTTVYTATVTNSFGCASSTSKTIIVNPNPTITVSSGSICNGSSFTITSSGASTYTYSGGSSIVTPTVNTSYTVTGTSAAGCIGTSGAVSSVTVNARPLLTVNSGSICNGSSFTMIPGGASTYTYSGGSAIVTPTLNTTYTVTGTSAAGCIGTSGVVSSVVVNAKPVLTVNSGSICNGSSFTMIPGGAISYTFSSGSAVVSPTVTTSYSVTGTNAAGCSNTAVSLLTVNARPILTVNSGSICNGSSFTMIPSGASTYTYSGGSAIVTPTVNTTYTVTGTSAAGCIGTTGAVSSVVVNAKPVLSVNSGTICSGNSFTMIPAGAATYVFSGGSAVVSPSVTTSYSVTGTNAAGCSNTIVSLLTVNAKPLLTVNSGSICSGNSFTMVPGGALSYTFSSGSAVVSPTVATSYSVTGTNAAGCSNTAVSLLTVNARPILTVNSGSICNGSSFTMIPGGASTYTYSGGSAIVIPTSNTSYTVTGTSAAGCLGVSGVVSSVVVNANPVLTVNSGSMCAGNSYTLLPTGALTYTYSSGSNVVTPTLTTTYSVTGANSFGCLGSSVGTVAVNALPTVTATSPNTLICNGQSSTLTAVSSATVFNWSTGQTTSNISVSPTVTSTYSVTVTGNNGCTSNSASVLVTVNICTSLQELFSDKVSVYPNPTTGLLNITLTGALDQFTFIEFYDAVGKLVVKQQLINELNSVNISDLTNGIYLFKILKNSSAVKIGKLVKQ